MAVLSENMLFGQAVAYATDSSAEFVQSSPEFSGELRQLLLPHVTAPSGLVSQNRPALQCLQAENHVILSRTISANRSSSPGRTDRVVTHFATIEKRYLDALQTNPALLAHVAMSNGALSTPSDLSAELQDLAVSTCSFWNHENLPVSVSESAARQVFRAVEVHDRVAIVGVAAPIRFLTALFAHCEPGVRAQQTFAINKWFGTAKSPQILFFDKNEQTRIMLVNAQIRNISLEQCV